MIQLPEGCVNGLCSGIGNRLREDGFAYSFVQRNLPACDPSRRSEVLLTERVSLRENVLTVRVTDLTRLAA